MCIRPRASSGVHDAHCRNPCQRPPLDTPVTVRLFGGAAHGATAVLIPLGARYSAIRKGCRKVEKSMSHGARGNRMYFIAGGVVLLLG